MVSTRPRSVRGATWSSQRVTNARRLHGIRCSGSVARSAVGARATQSASMNRGRPSVVSLTLVRTAVSVRGSVRGPASSDRNLHVAHPTDAERKPSVGPPS
jgi:hypothetical protein